MRIKKVAEKKISSNGINPENLSDELLLKRIACQKEKTAFYELFHRYRSSCYSLSMQILNNHSAAEDVLQDSMIRVWKHAGAYRRKAGSARTWIHRIVAFRSITAAQRLRTKRNYFQSKESFEGTPAKETTPQADGDLVSALRSSLDTLPELDRQVVVLQYGGGMSQKEVGEKLSLSRQVVAYRTQKAIRLLKTNLSKFGFCAAIPAIKACLDKAACSGLSSELSADTLISSTGFAEAAAEVSGGLGLKLFSTVSIVAVVFIGTAMTMKPAKLEKTTQSVVAPNTAQTNLFPKPANTLSLPHGWWFSNKIPTDWKVISGEYELWEQFASTPAVLASSPSGQTKLLLKPTVKPQQMVMYVHCNGAIIDNRANAQLHWVKDGKPLPHKTWGMQVKNPGNINFFIFYLIKNRIIVASADRATVYEYSEDFPGDRLMLWVSNLKIRRMRLERLHTMPKYIETLVNNQNVKKMNVKKFDPDNNPSLKRKRISKTWGFSQGTPQELKVNWGWDRLDNGQKYSQEKLQPWEKIEFYKLPDLTSLKPMRITAEFWQYKWISNLFTFDCQFGNYPFKSPKDPQRNWWELMKSKSKFKVVKQKLNKIEIYHYRMFKAHYLNDVFIIISHKAFNQPLKMEGSHFCLFTRNVKIKTLKMEEIEPNDLPREMQNPAALWRTIESKYSKRAERDRYSQPNIKSIDE